MKRFYYFFAMCGLLTAALVPQKAIAVATYENHVVTLTGVPEGAGVVYLVTDWNGHEWDPIDEMLYEEDEITVKATIETKDNKAICHLYAIPNEGYQFAGFFVDEDGDGKFDITKDAPITFTEDNDLNNRSNDEGQPRVYTSPIARQVVLTHESPNEYNAGPEAADNLAAAEAAAEADWEEFGCLNHFFAVFYEEGEENPITGIKAVAIRPDDIIYNLCGRRVGKDAKGLLFVGGKKRIIR